MGGMIFCDTYALCEFILGNKEYIKYFRDNKIVINKLNQIELFYKILREHGLETAKKYYYHFEPYVEDFGYEVIEVAMLFRLRNKEKKFSYADCIGYAYSRLNAIKFLTGDKEFRDLPNVEFIK